MRMSDDGKPDIALEIFREPEDMHNRYAIMSDTKVIFPDSIKFNYRKCIYTAKWS